MNVSLLISSDVNITFLFQFNTEKVPADYSHIFSVPGSRVIRLLGMLLLVFVTIACVDCVIFTYSMFIVDLAEYGVAYVIAYIIYIAFGRT